MINKEIKTAILVFGIFALCSTGASAQQGQDRGERREPPTFAQLIKDMDANEDGKLSEDELKGPLKENFAKVDTDEDGFITEEEFEKAPKPERPNRRQ